MKTFLISFSLLTLLLTGGLFWKGSIWFHEEFPDVRVLKSRYPIIHYEGRDEPEQVSFQKQRPATWVQLSAVSAAAVGAIIVSEDWAFYQHKGYDPNQIKSAIEESWEEGHFTRGASTITQQVAKNVFLTKEKNLWRKLKEFYLSIQLEQNLGKKKILETYLNIAEWGEGIYGIGPASEYYFRKSPSALSAKEGAFLAMLLPSPIRYSQSFRSRKLTDYASETINSILKKMEQAHYLTEEERLFEVSQPLSFELPSADTI